MIMIKLIMMIVIILMVVIVIVITVLIIICIVYTSPFCHKVITSKVMAVLLPVYK